MNGFSASAIQHTFYVVRELPSILGTVMIAMATTLGTEAQKGFVLTDNLVLSSSGLKFVTVMLTCACIRP